MVSSQPVKAKNPWSPFLQPLPQSLPAPPPLATSYANPANRSDRNSIAIAIKVYHTDGIAVAKTQSSISGRSLFRYLAANLCDCSTWLAAGLKLGLNVEGVCSIIGYGDVTIVQVEIATVWVDNIKAVYPSIHPANDSRVAEFWNADINKLGSVIIVPHVVLSSKSCFKVSIMEEYKVHLWLRDSLYAMREVSMAHQTWWKPAEVFSFAFVVVIVEQLLEDEPVILNNQSERLWQTLRVQLHIRSRCEMLDRMSRNSWGIRSEWGLYRPYWKSLGLRIRRWLALGLFHWQMYPERLGDLRFQLREVGGLILNCRDGESKMLGLCEVLYEYCLWKLYWDALREGSAWRLCADACVHGKSVRIWCECALMLYVESLRLCEKEFLYISHIDCLTQGHRREDDTILAAGQNGVEVEWCYLEA